MAPGTDDAIHAGAFGPLLHRHGAYEHAHPHRGAHRHLRHPHRSGGAGGALAHPTYRRLLIAQVVSLAGTGVTTVALGLLAYDLAGRAAGAVLGAALALKMVAYVGLSPVIAAFAHRVDRRRLLISLDLARAAVLAALPFVTQVWEVLTLVFVVNACAAGFTPAFQATIPDLLPDEDDFTQALSYSRIAYDLGDLLSPVAAAALLLAIDFHALFAVDAASFLASAALVASVRLPRPAEAGTTGDRTWRRITAGARVFLATPRLRALLALNLAAASASAMVIVNTVVLVRGELQLGPSQVAIALAVSGGGSALTAVSVPRLLRRHTDRAVMLLGAAVLAASLAATAVLSSYAALLAIWLAIGIGLSLLQTPVGRLLQRSAPPAERPQLFAAQFALSHLAWLIAYPVAGVVGSITGIAPVAAGLAVVTAAAGAIAAAVWPRARS